MSKVINILNKRKKLVILIGIILVLFIFLLLTIPKVKKGISKDQENNIYAHTEEGIIKEEEYEGVKFSNISMLTKDGYTTFTADITNIADSNIEKERLHVQLRDKEGKDVIKYLAYFPGGLKKGETKTIEAVAHGNFTDAYTKEIME